MEHGMTEAAQELCVAVKGGVIGVLAYFATIHYGILIAVIIMAFIDVAIGSRYAKKQGNFESRQFRNGVMHKMEELLIVVATVLAEYTITEIFVDVGIPFLPITNMFAGWLIYKDYGSIMETLISNGHELPNWLTRGYKVAKKKIEGSIENKIDEENKEE